MAIDNLQLFEKIKRQEKSGFMVIRQQLFGYIQQYVVNNGGRNDSAEDLFQEGLIALWQNIDSGKYQHSSDHKLLNYFITICKYKWLDKRKSDKSKYIEPITDQWDGNASIAENEWQYNEDEIEQKWKTFQMIDENCQKLLSQFYIEEKSFKEIALKNGWTEDTAKNNKYRCMEKIKKIINQQDARFSR